VTRSPHHTRWRHDRRALIVVTEAFSPFSAKVTAMSSPVTVMIDRLGPCDTNDAVAFPQALRSHPYTLRVAQMYIARDI